MSAANPTGPLRHFLQLRDFSEEEILYVIDRARLIKDKFKRYLPHHTLHDRNLAMVFEKNSTRTRASFDIAIRQLGGVPMILDAGTTQLGRGETIADTARVLSRYADAIMIRTDHHEKAEELAEYAGVPVINGLTDLSHPCQIVADLLTIVESGKALPGLELAWLGDGNNVLASLIEAAGLFGFNIRAGVPQGYEPDARFVEAARAKGARIDILRDAREAVAGADLVVTDAWVSMGQDHAHNKLAAMAPYQVDERLMGGAKTEANIGVLLQKMQSERIHMALVIDEYGGVDGLVTIEDLIEQVIGEIDDEHDEAEDGLWVEEKPGQYLVQARAPLDEFEAEIGMKLAHEDEGEEIDTIGGLVVMLTGRVPSRGEVVPHESGAEFEIIDADPRRIKRLRVRLPQTAE